MTIRVLVVEDQPKILKAQIKLLETFEEIAIVGEALSGESALEKVEEVKPDVILLDLGLPQMSGIDVTKRVKATHPEIEILIFTIFDEEDKVIEAIGAGAAGYLLKGTPVEKIVEAIKDVKAGGAVIQPNLARALLRLIGKKPAHRPPSGAAPGNVMPRPPSVPPSASATGDAGQAGGHSMPPNASAPMAEGVPGDVLLGENGEMLDSSDDDDGGSVLTDRELEILQIIAKGLSNNEAAKVLGLSKATIRTHLEHIYEKLDVTNRVEAVTEGIRQGIINI